MFLSSGKVLFNPLRMKRMCHIIRTQCVPCGKHSTSVIITNLLKACKAKGTVSSESHTELVNAM